MPVKEISGVFRDVMSITELRGSYPNVPISSDVDYAALIAGDETPTFLTLPIGKVGVTSGNKRHYDEEFVTELLRQTLANKPVGLMGHLSDAERASAFPAEAVHWVGAVRDGDTVWGKGYIPPGPVRERIAKYKATGKAIATSIDAFAEGVWDDKLGAHRMSAKNMRLNQIDIAPADRAGIPELAAVPHLTSEMEEAPATDRQQEQPTMADKQVDIIQELGKVQPHKGWQVPVARENAPDLTALTQEMTELRKQNEALMQAAVKSRITELVSDVKLEDVRSVVTEMVEGKQPHTVEEAEAAYQQVIEMTSVKNLLANTVQRVMGPKQGTPVQRQAGANKYFSIPQEA